MSSTRSDSAAKRRRFCRAILLLACQLLCVPLDASEEPVASVRLVDQSVLDRLREAGDQQTIERLGPLSEEIPKLAGHFGQPGELCHGGTAFRFLRFGGLRHPMLIEVHEESGSASLFAMAAPETAPWNRPTEYRELRRDLSDTEYQRLRSIVAEAGLWEELPWLRYETTRDGGDLWIYQMCAPGRRHVLLFQTRKNARVVRLGAELIEMALPIVPAQHRSVPRFE
jgi:hypothetical protein